MAQTASIPAERQDASPPKVATRLEPQRFAARDAGSMPAEATLDANGRVVPLPVTRLDQEHAASSCIPGRQHRPSEIRAIAEREAEAIGLAHQSLIAVLRAEGQLGSREVTTTPRITPAPNMVGQNCAALQASIRRGVQHLHEMRQRHPNPLHHLAAYLDGEEIFLRSGGVPDRPETLRFVVTALNELAGPVAELPSLSRQHATARRTGSARDTDPRDVQPVPVGASTQPVPDPRWASGFVFNLE